MSAACFGFGTINTLHPQRSLAWWRTNIAGLMWTHSYMRPIVSFSDSSYSSSPVMVVIFKLFLGITSISVNIRKHESALNLLERYSQDTPRSCLGPNQVCTLFGARPGSNTTSGSSCLLIAYDMNGRDIWRLNFVLHFNWIFLYQVTQIVVLEFLLVSVAHPIRYLNFQLRLQSNALVELLPVCSPRRHQTRKLNNRLCKWKASRLQVRAAGKDDSKDISLKRDVT